VLTTAVEPAAPEDSDYEQYLVATVADNGPGIPAEIVEKVFTPFFSTKPKGKGTGLGLAICKRIVDEHDGEITVDAQPAQGTCFTIRIPIRAEKPADNGVADKK
jgi:two-component system NtrC family sensor kinase